MKLRIVKFDGKPGVILPPELTTALDLDIGDYLYLVEMPDGSYCLIPNDEQQAAQLGLQVGLMHEQDA